MAVIKRSVSIAGHRTSFSVENAFFEALKALAEANETSLASLITEIDRTRPRDANLSSAIRLYVLAAAIKGDVKLADGPD